MAGSRSLGHTPGPARIVTANTAGGGPGPPDRRGVHDRAKYLIGADGARSKVASDIDLPMEGQMDIAGSMNLPLKADIWARGGPRPSVLYWVIQPGSNVGGIGAGLVR